MGTALRSLSGLIDFECAARWGSFKLAAQELHKTPAAVSQQIKQLEAALGFALFIRHARHLSVTEKGQDLAATVAKSLRDINTKVAALQQGDEECVLRISTTHSFAMKWLVPRLHGFTERHPDLDILIDSSDQLVDLADASFDVAIRHGRIKDLDRAEILLPERLVVVVSPALLKQKGSKAGLSLAALSKHALLHEGTPNDWLQLLRQNRINHAHYDFSRSYSRGGLLVQAAVAGHGVALASYSIAHADIQKGSLRVCPCHLPEPQYGYRVLYDSSKAQMRKIELFAAWMRAEFEEMERAFAAAMH